MAKNADHIHTPGDGRGIRKVMVNGKEVEKCFYADTKRGIADCYRSPFKVDKWRKRLLSKRYRGKVEVVYV